MGSKKKTKSGTMKRTFGESAQRSLAGKAKKKSKKGSNILLLQKGRSKGSKPGTGKTSESNKEGVLLRDQDRENGDRRLENGRPVPSSSSNDCQKRGPAGGALKEEGGGSTVFGFRYSVEGETTHMQCQKG